MVCNDSPANAWAKPVLRLTDCYDIVNFSADPFCAIEYTPVMDNSDQLEVAECFRVCIKNSSTHDQRREIFGKVFRMFGRAVNRYITGRGPRVYIEYATNEGEPCYRAELLATSKDINTARAGDIQIDDASLRWLWGEQILDIQVCIIREKCWEACDEVEIPLSSFVFGGEDITGGLSVGQFTESIGGTSLTQSNFVYVNQGLIEGDACAPVRWSIETGPNSSGGLKELYIGVSAFANHFNVTHIFEGEDASAASGSFTIQSSTGASNNEYAVADVPATDDDILCWFISGASLSASNGTCYRVLVRTSDLLPDDPDTEIYAELYEQAGDIPFWSSQRVRNTDTILDLGVVQLPPKSCSDCLPGTITPAPMRFCLRGRNKNGATTIGIDHIEFLATDGWRKLTEYRGLAFGRDQIITDDQITGELYTTNNDGCRANLIGVGEACVQPGLGHRFQFVFSDFDLLRVRAFYRPKRMLI